MRFPGFRTGFLFLVLGLAPAARAKTPAAREASNAARPAGAPQVAPASATTASAQLFEPGLADRRKRYARSTLGQIGMVPTYVLRAPFLMLNYPLEHLLVHKGPGPVTAYTQRQLSRFSDLGFAIGTSTLASGGALGMGLRYLLPRHWTGNVPVHLFAGASLRGYQRYSASLDSLRVGRVMMFANVQYDDRPQENFYGVGVATARGDRSDYSLRVPQASLSGLVNLRDNLRLGLQVGASRNDIGRGKSTKLAVSQDLFPDVYGLGAGSPIGPRRFEFVEYGATLLWDSRDWPTYTHRGSVLQLGVQAAEGIRDTKTAYTKYSLDAAHFVRLPGEKRTLAVRLRGVATDNRSSDGTQVPVFRLEQLGGARTLSGYNNYRFADQELVLGNVEYRFPIWNLELSSGVGIDGVVFFDAGAVLPNLRDLRQRDLRNDAGFGFRWVTSRRLRLRADVAFSAETTRINFGLTGTI